LWKWQEFSSSDGVPARNINPLDNLTKAERKKDWNRFREISMSLSVSCDICRNRNTYITSFNIV
jgi:hypothetical protein